MTLAQAPRRDSCMACGQPAGAGREILYCAECDGFWHRDCRNDVGPRCFSCQTPTHDYQKRSKADRDELEQEFAAVLDLALSVQRLAVLAISSPHDHLDRYLLVYAGVSALGGPPQDGERTRDQVFEVVFGKQLTDPPRVYCHPRLYHPRVSPTGRVSLDANVPRESASRLVNIALWLDKLLRSSYAKPDSNGSGGDIVNAVAGDWLRDHSPREPRRRETLLGEAEANGWSPWSAVTDEAGPEAEETDEPAFVAEVAQGLSAAWQVLITTLDGIADAANMNTGDIEQGEALRRAVQAMASAEGQAEAWPERLAEALDGIDARAMLRVRKAAQLALALSARVDASVPASRLVPARVADYTEGQRHEGTVLVDPTVEVADLLDVLAGSRVVEPGPGRRLWLLVECAPRFDWPEPHVPLTPALGRLRRNPMPLIAFWDVYRVHRQCREGLIRELRAVDATTEWRTLENLGFVPGGLIEIRECSSKKSRSVPADLGKAHKAPSAENRKVSLWLDKPLGLSLNDLLKTGALPAEDDLGRPIWYEFRSSLGEDERVLPPDLVLTQEQHDTLLPYVIETPRTAALRAQGDCGELVRQARLARAAEDLPTHRGLSYCSFGLPPERHVIERKGARDVSVELRASDGARPCWGARQGLGPEAKTLDVAADEASDLGQVLRSIFEDEAAGA